MYKCNEKKNVKKRQTTESNLQIQTSMIEYYANGFLLTLFFYFFFFCFIFVIGRFFFLLMW